MTQPSKWTASELRTIWAVVVDGSVFIGWTEGPDKPWFRATKNRGVGRFQAGSLVTDGTFNDAAALDQGPIEAEYRRKYHRSSDRNGNRAAGSTATLRPAPCARVPHISTGRSAKRQVGTPRREERSSCSAFT